MFSKAFDEVGNLPTWHHVDFDAPVKRDTWRDARNRRRPKRRRQSRRKSFPLTVTARDVPLRLWTTRNDRTSRMRWLASGRSCALTRETVVRILSRPMPRRERTATSVVRSTHEVAANAVLRSLLYGLSQSVQTFSSFWVT